MHGSVFRFEMRRRSSKEPKAKSGNEGAMRMSEAINKDNDGMKNEMTWTNIMDRDGD